MICGPTAVQEFQEARRFTEGAWTYHLFHHGSGRVNQAVDDWISRLESRSPKTYRLLLSLARRMLSLDEKQRPKANELTSTLRIIALREAAKTVDELSSRIFKQSESLSLDALIEQKRFEAWKYAVEMPDRVNSSDCRCFNKFRLSG